MANGKSSKRNVVHSKKARWYHMILAAIIGPVWFQFIINRELPDNGMLFVTIFLLPAIAVFIAASVLVERLLRMRNSKDGE